MEQTDLKSAFTGSTADDYIKGRRGKLPSGAVAKFNKQKFVPTGEQAAPDALHNAKQPNLTIISEKPEHRLIMYLKAQGMTNKEIFIHLGGDYNNGQPITGNGTYSYPYLGQIIRQPWFQTGVVRLLNEAGKDVIEAKLEAECLPSLETAIAIRDSAEVPATVRLAAAKDIMDRFRGKAVTHIKSEAKVTYASAEQEAKALKDEIERLEKDTASHRN